LNKIPQNSKVEINASSTVYISHDVLDLITEFKEIKKRFKFESKIIWF
jgi:hypothetical protein